jgi:DNA-binding response OmpR family regulator
LPTVLITDDELDHREVLTMALRRLGYDVVAAADATAAMTLLHGGGIDAALVDVRMPGGSGIDLCRRIRDDPATENLPILVVSADVQHQQIMMVMHAGADDFLPKPFRRAELYERLDALLQPNDGPALRSTAASRAALAATRQSTPATVAYPRTAWRPA